MSEWKRRCRRTKAGKRREDRERQIWLLLGLEAGVWICTFGDLWRQCDNPLKLVCRVARKRGCTGDGGGLQVQLIRAVYTQARSWMHECVQVCTVDGRLAMASNLAVTESSEAGRAE